MPNSRYYFANDIVRLAETAIELSGIDSDIKKKSKRKYYSTLIAFVNEKARRAKSTHLPDDFSLITDYRFFINNYEKHLETIAKEGNDVKVRATTSFVNTLIRCTEEIITPIIVKKKRELL